MTSSPGAITQACNASPCTITGLDNGTAYTFTVHATSGAGDSLESAATGSVTPVGTPHRPTGVSAQAGNHEAVVTFTAPVDDGGSPITGYTVTSSPGGLTATCSASPCTITGLTNGTAYTFTVHATNAQGDSTESTATSSVTPAMPPGAPTGVSVTAGDAQATVSFTAPADNGGSAVAGYTVTSSPGGITQACNASPCTITGLDNGTAYTFTVHATNDAGDSVESVATTSVTPVGDPGVPTGVTAESGHGQAVVHFAAPADNGGSPITGYTVTSSPGGITQACDASPCTITGLDNGTAYTFTVHATSGAGDSTESAQTTSVTPVGPPGGPGTVTVTPGNGSVSVSFPAPGDGGSPINGYQVSTDGGLSWHTLYATTVGGVVTGTVTGLANGAAYQVQVRAVNAQGPGVASTEHRVVPRTVPGTPGALRVVSGNRRATVSFTAAGDGGATISAYQYSLDGVNWHRLVTSTTGSRLSGVVSGLVNGATYSVMVRAVNAAGAGESTDAVTAKPAAPATGWFKDPMTRAQRAHLVAVPANPQHVHGRLRTTRALYRTHANRLAVPLSVVRGHQLSRRQAVVVDGLFRFDSASLSAAGRHKLRVLAASMDSVHALTCEGYTDYSGTAHHHAVLSRHRALTVCRALHRFTGARTRPVGYGDARPVKIGGRQLSRFPNRRVVVVVNR